eukprot:scaffold1090_cov135-Isochrysis_galbana.AAC.5
MRHRAAPIVCGPAGGDLGLTQAVGSKLLVVLHRPTLEVHVVDELARVAPTREDLGRVPHLVVQRAPVEVGADIVNRPLGRRRRRRRGQEPRRLCGRDTRRRPAVSGPRRRHRAPSAHGGAGGHRKFSQVPKSPRSALVPLSSHLPRVSCEDYICKAHVLVLAALAHTHVACARRRRTCLQPRVKVAIRWVIVTHRAEPDVRCVGNASSAAGRRPRFLALRKLLGVLGDHAPGATPEIVQAALRYSVLAPSTGISRQLRASIATSRQAVKAGAHNRSYAVGLRRLGALTFPPLSPPPRIVHHQACCLFIFHGGAAGLILEPAFI